MIPLCYCCGNPSGGTSCMVTGENVTVRLVPVCLDCETRRRQEERTLRTGQDLITDRAANHPEGDPQSPALGRVIGPPA
jgi:hypothetical protein